MADKATTTVSNPGPATQENEPITDPSAVTAEQAAAFGLEATEEPKKADDPGKKAPISDKADPKADPDKESTSKPGPGEKDESQPAPKYAGKYHTPEALEQAVIAGHTHIRKLEDENKDLRGFELKVAELEKQIATTTKTEPKKAKDELKDDADFKVLRELFADNFGDEGAQALDAVLSKLNRERTGEPVDPSVMAEISQLKADRVADQFYSAHPEAKEPIVKEAIDEILDSMATKADDPLFTMELVLGLAKAKLLPTLIDKGVLAKVKSMSKKDKEALLAGNLVSGDVTGGDAPGPTDATSMKDLQKAYFGDDAVK